MACVAGSEVSGRGGKFRGLSVWIVVGDGVVVIGGIIWVVGGRGRSELSVEGLTFSSGVACSGCVVLEVGGGSGGEFGGVGSEEGGASVSVGSCGVGSGGSLAEFFWLWRAC